MPLILFSFAYQTETKQASLVGNVSSQVALQILQGLIIAEAIQKAGGDGADKVEVIEKQTS